MTARDCRAPQGERAGRSAPRIAWCTLVCLNALGLMWSAPAAAQLLGIPQITVEMPNPGQAPDLGPVGVLERKNREYQPQGFQLGRVNVQPALTGSSTYNSNIFATSANPTGDMLLSLRPEVTLDSGPGSTIYRFNAFGLWDNYLANPGLSNINGGASLGVSAGSDQTLLLQSATGFLYAHQDPASFSSSVQNGVVSSLPSYTTLLQTLSATHQPGVVGASLAASYQRIDLQNVFVNGALLNQSQFDGNTYTVSPKLSYLVAPPTNVFVQFDYGRQAYDNGTNNSSTYTGKVGSDFEFRRLFRGNAFVGYRYRNYDSSTTGSVGSFTYGLSAAWYPTELMTVKLSGLQDFRDTPLLNGGFSTVDAKTLQGEIDYEILPQVIAAAAFSLEDDNYRTVSQHDDIMRVGGNLTYLINRNVNLAFQYLYSTRTSTQATFGYERHQAQVALKLQY